jgi:hypothetical protein
MPAILGVDAPFSFYDMDPYQIIIIKFLINKRNSYFSFVLQQTCANLEVYENIISSSGVKAPLGEK